MNVKRSIVEFVAKVSYKEAEKSANTACVFFHGQPKIPKCVQELKRVKIEK